MEKGHAELQQYHYQEILTNLTYMTEGITEIRIQEALVELPIARVEIEKEVEPITPSQSKMWNAIQQLRGEVRYLRNNLNKHLDKLKKKTYTIK